MSKPEPNADGYCYRGQDDPSSLGICMIFALMILTFVSVYRVGYSRGKTAADRWYAKQTENVQVWNWVASESKSVTVNGELNRVSDCDDCIIIGKGIAMVHGAHLAAVTCSAETDGTVIEGVYRYENRKQFLQLICSRPNDTGFQWKVNH